MSLPFLRRGRALGISVSDGSIECLELEPAARGSFAVLGRARADLPAGAVVRGAIADEDAFVKALREAVQGADALSADALVALPDLLTYVHLFRFPGSVPDREVRDALAFQEEEAIPFPMNDVVMDYRVVSRGEGGTSVLAAFAPRAACEAYARACERAGLRSARLIPEAQALGAALVPAREDGKGTLVIDVGDAYAGISLHAGAEVRATFSVGAAGAEVTRLLMGAKKPRSRAEAEAFKRKASPEATRAYAQVAAAIAARVRSVDGWYAQRGGTLGGIVLTGGTSLSHAFVTALSSALTHAVPKASVRLGALPDDPLSPADTALYAAAYGAAMLASAAPFDLSGHGAAPKVSKSQARAGAEEPADDEDAPSLKERLEGTSQRARVFLAATFIVLALGALGYVLYERMQASRAVDEQIRALEARSEGAGGVAP